MRGRGRLVGSLFLALAGLLSPGGVATAQPKQQPAKAKPSGPRKQAAREKDWPRQIRFGEATLFLDAPEAESLEGTHFKGRSSARMVQAETEPAFGAVWYDADVEINRDRRIVTLVSVRVPRVELAGAPPARQQRMATRLAEVLTRQQWKLPLDDILASAKLAQWRQEVVPPKLGTEPPRILFETEPAILILFDGEPRFRTVEGSKLERSLNTPFLVLHDAKANVYYLNGGTTWFRASEG